jgi:hypothetical protein
MESIIDSHPAKNAVDDSKNAHPLFHSSSNMPAFTA